MKYTFCSNRINVTKYDATFATKRGSNPKPLLLPTVATPLYFEYVSKNGSFKHPPQRP